MTDPRIVTPRLILTRLGDDDGESLFGYRSDPGVARYQTWVPQSSDDARRFIEELRLVSFDTPGTWFQLGIRLSDSSLLVGDVGVHFPADLPRQAEIGFTVAPSHQGRGLGAEAVTGLLGYLFGPLQKHRVYASVDPRNKRSLALLRCVGMRQEAHFRESLWFKGEWADDVVFAILESEWQER